MRGSGSIRRWLWLGLLLPALLLLGGRGQANPGLKNDVVGSAHDLTPGSTVQDACLFCHTPHTSLVADKPLWDHQLSTQTYTTYTSSTFDAGPIPGTAPAQGVSKLCLSCHDGTVALGQTVLAGLLSTSATLTADTNLTTDLTNDHPLAMQPVDDGQLVLSLFGSPPTSGDPTNVKLPGGRIECTSCHDPHSQALDAAAQSFLVRSNSGGTLCLACHDPSRAQPNALNGWLTGAHSTATNTVPTTSSFGPYGSVNANACGNCHRLHSMGATAAARLLRAAEETSCSPCHSGANVTPALKNVLGDFSKASRHPTTTLSGLHDPTENAFPLAANRHAECPDCHNPHPAQLTLSADDNPPAVEHPLVGASGYNGTTALRPAQNEYQVCFKCHADSGNLGSSPTRQLNTVNTRLEFASTVSRHNVSNSRGGTGSNNTVPSLRPTILYPNGSRGRSLGAGTFIYCTDCHNSDTARKFGGAGANGPHGSANSQILVRPHPRNGAPASPGGLMTDVPFTSGAVTYPLCNTCHCLDRSETECTQPLFDDSTFRHLSHVNGSQLQVSCDNCHDPHGIAGGNATNNPSLINFDIVRVGAGSRGGPTLTRSGIYKGNCDLMCHNVDHRSRGY